MNNAIAALFNFVMYLTHMSIRGGAAGSTQAFLETHQLDIHFSDMFDGNILMMVIVRGAAAAPPDHHRNDRSEVYTKSMQSFVLSRSQFQQTIGKDGWSEKALVYIKAICSCYVAPDGVERMLRNALMGDHLYTRIQYKKMGITIETDEGRRRYKEGIPSTEFSRFIREASVEEKEKVYGEVIDGAIARQNTYLENLSNNGANQNG